MYINSGGVKEYCKDYGIEYTKSNFQEKLNQMMKNYNLFYKKMANYPFNSDEMCKEFLQLFLEMKTNKTNLLAKRPIEKVGILESKLYYFKRIINSKV